MKTDLHKPNKIHVGKLKNVQIILLFSAIVDMKVELSRPYSNILSYMLFLFVL